MDIPLLMFLGSIAVGVIVLIILRSQRSATATFAELAKAQAAWQKMRPKITEQLEPETYRTAQDGSRRLNGFGGQVGRLIAVQRPGRVSACAAMVPDADVHAVSDLINAHHVLQSRGMQIEKRLREVVQSRVRTAEERRIMARAFRRWVLGQSAEAISGLLVDPKVSAKRRRAAEEAVAAGIALVDESGDLGELTERFVEALERADASYAEARHLLRG